MPSNSGTYFGTVYEPMYLAGIAAGSATESDKLGYVYAFPIPQTIANINAFERGAQSVNPDVETITVSVVVVRPRQAAGSRRACCRRASTSSPSTRTAPRPSSRPPRRRALPTVGYHADASSIAPKGWLTGAVWD